MHLTRRGCGSVASTNIVPPALHIKLGVVNKILAAIDAVEDVWQQQRSWSSTSADPVSQAVAHLARAFHIPASAGKNTIRGSYLECLAQI